MAISLFQLLLQLKGEKRDAELEDYGFHYTPPSLMYGDKTIQEMSLLQAQYQDFIVTKTGYVTGALKVSGINIDLLTLDEQSDLFSDYNSFLMGSLGETNDEMQQYIDSTMPVNFQDYLLFWKRRYVEVQRQSPVNEALLELIASYIHTYSAYKQENTLTTKLHVVVLREKIEHNNIQALEQAAQLLDEKIIVYKRNLEAALSQYEFVVEKMTAYDYLHYLKHFFNNADSY
ncbi:MAG: TrsD/TraD family conjugative transfer protein [Caryophanon sp.]|nr:TrsD/TraD family conjugative transfer protein [Caryophanon sp.]